MTAYIFEINSVEFCLTIAETNEKNYLCMDNSHNLINELKYGEMFISSNLKYESRYTPLQLYIRQILQSDKYMKKRIEDKLEESILFMNIQIKEANERYLKNLNEFLELNFFHITSNSNILNEFEKCGSNLIVLCFMHSFSIQMIRNEIKCNKKDLSVFKYYIPCNLFDLDLSSINNVLLFFFNVNLIGFRGKLDDDEYFYDFIEFNQISFYELISKLKEKNNCSIKSCCQNEELNNFLLQTCAHNEISFSKENEESILNDIFKNSFQKQF